MADFCHGCLVDEGMSEFAEKNDFKGICNPGDLSYFLCEGCGQHLFDHEGRRQCTSVSWYVDPERVVLFGCQECVVLAKEYLDKRSTGEN